MKCTQYGLYGQATFKNARAIFYFQSRAERATIFNWDLKKLDFFCGGLPAGVGSWAPAPIHLPLKVRRGKSN